MDMVWQGRATGEVLEGGQDGQAWRRTRRLAQKGLTTTINTMPMNSTTDTSGGPQGEVVKFQIRAVFKGPGVVVATTADAKGAAQLKPKS